jgi:hypothetical protein
LNTSNALVKGLEDCTYELNLEAYDNIQGFRILHNQVETAFMDFSNAETRLAYWIYQICENYLYRHELNEDGKSLRFPTKEDYLREVDRVTGRGVSTLKRDIGAIKVARALNYTVTDLAIRGIQVFVKIYQNFETDKDGNPLALKTGPSPQDKEPQAYAVEAVEALTAGGDHLTDSDMGARKTDRAALEHQMLRPGMARIWTEENEHGNFWFYEKYVDAALTHLAGEILIEQNGGQKVTIEIIGETIPEEVKTYFISKKLGIQRS